MKEYEKVTNETKEANVTYMGSKFRGFCAGFVAVCTGLVLVPALGVSPAHAADWWDAGSIIEDAVFFDSTAMNEAEIRSFIKSKGANCTSKGSDKCLKDLKVSTTVTQPKRSTGCKPLPALKDADAARVIAETAKACGINPQVILVTIQKEQSGVTQARPQATWDKAMGAYCPENGCKPEAKGFAKQIYFGADMLRGYTEKPQEYPAVAAFKAGTPYGLKTGSKASCPKINVKIKNVATAALYTYTPYTPNAATVRAYPGASPDKNCVHTGYLNFANYMRTWFPRQDIARIKGSTRVETAIATSKRAFPNGANVVYIGRQDVLADAQTGATLKDGPVLLVPSKGSLPAAVKQELGRLGAKEVILLGGTGAVSDQIGQQAQGVTGARLSRLDGKDRFATSRSIAQRWVNLYGTPREVYVANGVGKVGSIDAAVASSLSAGPLLTTSANDDPSQTRTWIENNAPGATHFAIGGSGVLSNGLLGQIAPGDWPRLSGKNRYDTSVAVARHALKTGTGTDSIYVATGRTLPDSAVAGVLRDGAVVLVGTTTGPAGQLIREVRPGKVWILGGTGAVSNSLASQLSNY